MCVRTRALIKWCDETKVQRRNLGMCDRTLSSMGGCIADGYMYNNTLKSGRITDCLVKFSDFFKAADPETHFTVDALKDMQKECNARRGMATLFVKERGGWQGGTRMEKARDKWQEKAARCEHGARGGSASCGARG